MKLPKFRRGLSQYTNAQSQSIPGPDSTKYITSNVNSRINIKNEVHKLLQNPQLNDNIFRFCVTANTCSVSPQLRICLSNLVPKTVDLKFTNSKSILQHQKFTVIFVLKSLSKLPSLVYTNNRHEENTPDSDISHLEYLSLNDIFKLSINSLSSRYKGRIEEHSREVLEIFDSLIDTCKFVSRHNLSHIYSYLTNTISSFAIDISNDLVTEFSNKKQNLYPVIFTVGKYLEIHGIKNKELYDIIYNSICNPEKWIQMNYSKVNYQKFILDSVTNLLQFKLPQENIDKLIQYLLVSDILSINHWSTLFLHLTRFSFNKDTLDLALMTFIRKYKYCKFPTTIDSTEINYEIEEIPSVTSLIKTINLTTNDVYFNVKATRTCHDKTYTRLADSEADYTFNIISGIINIIKRVKLDEVGISHIDEILELLLPRVIQLLPTYSLLHLKPIATSYIDYISKHIVSFSDMGYSSKQRNIVRSIATELLKFIPTFTLEDYLQCSDILSKLHCNIEYLDKTCTTGFISNQLIIDGIHEGLDDTYGMSMQDQIFTLDFASAVKLSQNLFKLNKVIESEKIEKLTILLKERIINCLGSMNQDHCNANSYSIVLLNMISSNFKGITQFMESFDNVSRCIKILSIDDKIDILRITTGQSVNEDFLSLLVEDLREDISTSKNELKLFKSVIILKKLIETLESPFITSFLSYAIPYINGDFIGELLEISTCIDPTNPISRQFITATLTSATTRQLSILQLRDYLICCRLIGHSIDLNKFLDVPLHTATIQQIESILSEIVKSRICNQRAIKRLADWSIHLFSEDHDTTSLPIPLVIDCFSKILSHLSFFNITNTKLSSLSLSLLHKHYKDYQTNVIPLLNSLVKLDQYPNNFGEIFTHLLIYTNNTSNLQPCIYKDLYEIYLQALVTDNSIHQLLESQNQLDLLNGLPSYHWFKEQETLANNFKNSESYGILFDVLSEITGLSPKSSTNPYFIHFIFDDSKDSNYNNLVILLSTPLDKTTNNEPCGDFLLKMNYMNKLGYKTILLDSTTLNDNLREKLTRLL